MKDNALNDRCKNPVKDTDLPGPDTFGRSQSVDRNATVFDVATYILEKTGRITSMKLQKLVYYAQSWSLVWDEKPLFDEPFEAWANGPVSPALYQEHKGRFDVNQHDIPGKSSVLTDDQRETVDMVIDFYGNETAQWLSDLTHLEAPWKLTRERAGVSAGDKCNEEILLADMHEYYSGLVPDSAPE